MSIYEELKPIMQRLNQVQSAVEVQELFTDLCTNLPWESSEHIPWRSEKTAADNMFAQLVAGEDPPLWRTHRAADPFSGVGEDWSHGSLLAFPLSNGESGLGFGNGALPANVSFVTQFKNLMGEQRPVGGDFSLEWIADNEGNPQFRQAALAEVQPLGDVVAQLRASKLSSVDAINAVYETPLSKSTADVERRYLARPHGTDGYQVFEIPNTLEWNNLIAKIDSFDREMIAKPRSLADMPPAARKGEKCAPIEDIFARVEAAGKGRPLSTLNPPEVEEKLLAASERNRDVILGAKAAYLLRIADGDMAIINPDKLKVDLRDQADVLTRVVETISRKRAEVLLDRQSEWRFAYSPEVARAMNNALQDRMLGFNLTPAINTLRETVDSRVKATEFISQGSLDERPLNIQTGIYVGPIVSETKHHVVQDLGRQSCVIHPKSILGQDKFNDVKMLRAHYKDGTPKLEGLNNNDRHRETGAPHHSR